MLVPIDDGIKASLATLEMVKFSYTSRVVEKALSGQEVESAKQNLNQLAQLVESMRQNLPESIIDDDNEIIARSSNKMQQTLIAPSDSSHRMGIESTAIDVDDSGKTPEVNKHLSGDLTINTPHSNDCVMSGSEGSRAQLSTDDRAKSIEPSHRRLSAPCLMPMNEEGFDQEVVVPDVFPRKKSIFSPFSRYRKGTVHPLKEDIEAGGSPQVATTMTYNVGDENADLKVASREAFRLIDENGDGFLQKEEVARAIDMMCEHGEMDLDGLSSLDLAEKMMNEVDVDGDGQIDMDEFTLMMERTSSSGRGKMSTQRFTHRMSTLAKNVLTAHQKKLENAVIGHDIWLIHPLSNTHATWDIVVSVLILLTVITMPLCLGWEVLNDELYTMNLVVDFIFMIDVCKNFCTGYMDANDTIIMSAKLVRKNYLTGFFLADFSSSIPLDLILKIARLESGGSITSAKQSLKMLKLIRMAKLFRLFRLNRLFLYMKRLIIFVEETMQFRISDGFTKLLRLSVGTLVLAHWIGCFNFLLLRLNDFPPDSWLVYAGLLDKDPFTQWSWSFFKALSQMIMIGFETPPFTNASCDALSDWCTIEYWTTLLCLYIGAIFYSILISSISSILHTASRSSRQFDEKLLIFDEYMRSKKLPAAMREKMKDYYYLRFGNGKIHNESEILDLLSPELRREIKQYNSKEILKKIPLLSNPACRDFAKDIACVLEPMIIFANEVIMREGTMGDEIFFISSGVVEIYLSSIRSSSYVAVGDGCYFGDVSVLLGVRRTASAKSITQCTLFCLSKTALLALLRDYPAIETRMTNVAQSRRRRLAHYKNPGSNTLAPGDDVDVEDSKTELFGKDAAKILQDKEKATELERIQSGRTTRRRNALPLRVQLTSPPKAKIT